MVATQSFWQLCILLSNFNLENLGFNAHKKKFQPWKESSKNIFVKAGRMQSHTNSCSKTQAGFLLLSSYTLSQKSNFYTNIQYWKNYLNIWIFAPKSMIFLYFGLKKFSIKYFHPCEFLEYSDTVCPCKLILFPADRKVFFYAGKPKLFYENWERATRSEKRRISFLTVAVRKAKLTAHFTGECIQGDPKS